jgi:hypothetical protein
MFSFRPRDRERILDALKPQPRPQEASGLISRLERAVALYKGWEAFERRQLPESEVKRSVRQLHRQVDGLQKALCDLDLSTRRALAPFLVQSRAPSLPLLSAEKPPELIRLHRQLSLLYRRLAVVGGVCSEYLWYRFERPPRRGPKARTAQESLAVAVADALLVCLPAFRITSTAEGAYEKIVRACFEAAGVRGTGDLHRIVLSALRAQRKTYRARGGKLPVP